MATAALALATVFVTLLAPLPPVKAADHAESTSVAGDLGADIADVFAFLDPNDNTKVVRFETFSCRCKISRKSFFTESEYQAQTNTLS